MQVQSGYYSHARPQAQSNNIHTNGNGIHPADTTQQLSSSGYTNGHINENQAASAEEMNPYNQHSYPPAGYGYQQPPPQHQQSSQQQRFPPPTLPPMQTSMGAHAPPPFSGPVPSSSSAAYAPHSAPQHMYGGVPGMPSQLPQPGMAGQAPASQSQERQMSKSGTKDGYSYSLEVCQQPQRARMCGFGDKDRRPITPPPCVRLRIIDTRTGKEASVDDFEGTFFVLQVDLWDEKGDREVNIVRASSSSPAVSISTATTTSFPPPPERPMQVMGEMAPSSMVIMGADGRPYMAPGYRPGYPSAPSAFQDPYGQQTYPGAPMPYMPPSQASSAMYTRNLIGSLTVNASRLDDPDGKPGLWFVLQDLSVRTEGFFR